MKALLSGFLFPLLFVYPESAAGSDTSKLTSELPKRVPGIWRITTISPEIGMQSNEVCTQDSDSVIGPRGRDCAPPSVSRIDDQVIVTIECGAGEQREVESLLFTGDFQTWYRAQSRTTAGARRSGYTIDAKFLTPTCTRG